MHACPLDASLVRDYVPRCMHKTCAQCCAKAHVISMHMYKRPCYVPRTSEFAQVRWDFTVWGSYLCIIGW